MKLWQWIRVMVDRLFRRKRRTVTEDSGQLIDNPRDRRLPCAERVDTRQGGPNMPKRQPCPLCTSWVKRARKTMSGAHYYCSKCKHGRFVRAR